MTWPHVFIVFVTLGDALSYMIDTFNLLLTKGLIEWEKFQYQSFVSKDVII